MALLTTWDKNNRVIDQGLTITYSMTKVSGKTTWWVRGYEYHRYAQASYKYVGMDYETAKLCAQAMIMKYTRPYTTASLDDDTFMDYRNRSTGVRCMASVTVQKTQGSMYEVDVSINEDDSKMSWLAVSNAAALFTTENSRDYDGLNGEDDEEEEEA